MRQRIVSFIDVEQWVLANYYSHLSASREKHVRSLFRRYFHHAKWYSVPLPDLTSHDLTVWFHRIKAVHPQEANHCLAVFRVCWKQAQIAGMIQETLQAPGQLLRKTPANRRSRFVTQDEMPRLLDSLRKAEPDLRGFVEFVLETGCRSAEALQAEWGDFDLASGMWHKPAAKTKSGRAHSLSLTKGALTILQALKVAGRERPFPLSKGWYEGRWLKFRDTCGLPDVTFHDLRRTRLTWLAAHGMALKDLQRVADHCTIASTEPYLHQFGNMGAQRQAMERVSHAMRQGPAEVA